ncbi:hypothetical protein PEDI_56370 [Persicobacter diffluens]|uniref:Transposase IS66 central domain-containing protein n=1 Tax=Persicobacter diffluens TaxID=981 RepID=A0AAN5APU2_9BACT|nr:hypothetical protein PEDI_52130 [Persicobacter diffluens]GJM65085.1 hypothetical protein PEDI_56370 [Persicobacter diffluens]
MQEASYICVPKLHWDKMTSDLDFYKKWYANRKTERYAPGTEVDNQQLAIDFAGESVIDENITSSEGNSNRKEVIVELENIPEGAKFIRYETTEVLEVTPPSVSVLVIKRPVFMVPEDDDRFRYVTADYPDFLPIPKSNTSASLLAYLIVSKFVDHLPIYRMVQMFRRDGIIFNSSTINNWFKKVHELLQCLYEKLVDQVQQASYIQADETTIKLARKGGTVDNYMWYYHAPLEKVACLQYQKERAAEYADDFFLDYEGDFAQADGYAGYNHLKDRGITLLA